MGIFEIGEEHNKIRLENKEGGSEIVINVALIQDDVGWNPRWPIFHERADPYEEHEEHEGENEGKITRGTQENTQTNKNDHTCTRSMNTKEIQNPKSTTDDTRGNRFFSMRRS